MDYCTGNIRQQFKGKIESNRIEYKKLIKEIDRMDFQIKSSLFPSNNKSPLGEEKFNYLNDKLISNTNKLITSSKTANEIEERDKITAEELKRQGNVLMNVRGKIDTAEQNLTIIQQINDIMKYSDLFYRFKLCLIAIGLFVAIVFVLYLKMK